MIDSASRRSAALEASERERRITEMKLEELKKRKSRS
jgi:hypothetical protein